MNIIKFYIRKSLSHMYRRVCMFFWEKRYGNCHGKGIKYLFFDNDKDNKNKALLFCFPAIAHGKPKYNFVKTLHNFKVKKVFLLDEIGGSEVKGNYLIEESVEKEVTKLIAMLIERYEPNKIIFVGSSKGGYSALYYSFKFENVYCICGAPQYFLGDYLSDVSDDGLRFIIRGEDYEIGKQRLNHLLKNTLEKSEIVPKKIFFHYSKEEHTFEEHIKYLLSDLNCKGVDLETDVCDYSSHKELVSYFPPFLKRTLTNILNQ